MWHKQIEIYVWPVLLVLLGALACGDSGDTPPGPGGTTPPTISIDNQTVAEGGTAVVTVSLNKDAVSRVVFDYTTSDISAIAGADYTGMSGTDTISAGSSSAAILIATIDDFDVEGAEQFSVALSSVTGATVATSLATCTINDNDSAPVSFASQVQPLLRTSCAKLGTCHGGDFPGGGMSIDTSAAYDSVMAATGNVTGGPVVVAGNSAASTLYTKTTDPSPFGSRMPQGAAPLSLAQQSLIRNWIDQGAQDN